MSTETSIEILYYAAILLTAWAAITTLEARETRNRVHRLERAARNQARDIELLKRDNPATPSNPVIYDQAANIINLDTRRKAH